MPKLNSSQVDAVLSALDGWSLDLAPATSAPQSEGERPAALSKTFEFRDFSSAMIWVNRVAEEVEEIDHHPDILIQYSRVTLWLWSHDVGGISERDAMLAEHLDDLPRHLEDE